MLFSKIYIVICHSNLKFTNMFYILKYMFINLRYEYYVSSTTDMKLTLVRYDIWKI